MYKIKDIEKEYNVDFNTKEKDLATYLAKIGLKSMSKVLKIIQNKLK